jgi:hypothetical protein
MSSFPFAPCGYSIEWAFSVEALTDKVQALMGPNTPRAYWTPCGPPQGVGDRFFQAMVFHDPSFFEVGT